MKPERRVGNMMLSAGIYVRVGNIVLLAGIYVRVGNMVLLTGVSGLRQLP